MSNGSSLPVGIIVPYAGVLATLPAGWLLCDGSALAVSSYSTLYGAIGNCWGGNQVTFNLPDLRGYFLRGVDDGAGVDPDAATRTTSMTNNPLGDGNSGDAVGSTQADQVGPFTLSVPLQYSNASSDSTNAFLTGYQKTGLVGGYMANANSGNILQGAATGSQTTTETRATNKYVYWIIYSGVTS